VAALGAVVFAVAGVLWVESGRHDERARLTHASSFAPPVHLAADTSYVRTRVLPSGQLIVTHWIRSDTWIYAVTVTTPKVIGLDPASVTSSRFKLASNGTAAPTASSRGVAGTRVFQLPPTHQLYLRYRLSGVVERSGRSDGRDLARITSLDVSTSSTLTRTTRLIVGATVLALACTPTGQTVAAPCGTEHGGIWSVRLGPEQQASHVMAQLDLR
jgi:hypothetical protein